jgi:hypothetical protein
LGAKLADLTRPPHIDKSSLIRDVWEYKQVIAAERWLQDVLMKPGYFDRLCIHEGAHLFYARQIFPEAKIRPPSVMYFKNAFRPLEAGIDLNGINKTCDRERLITFVKGLQAGGIAESLHLLEQNKTVADALSESGDRDDLANYWTHCEQIRKASPGLEFDEMEVWNEAGRAVFADLCNPQVKSEVDKVTEEVHQFLLAAMYSDEPPIVSSGDGSSSD